MERTLSLLTIVLIILFALVSCENEKAKETRKLQSDLQTFFKSNMMDSASTLDSFKLVSIDTITQKMYLYEQSSILHSQLDGLVNLLNLSNQEMRHSINQIKLYSLLESRTLVDIERSDLKKKAEKGQIINTEIDSVLSVVKRIDSTAMIADSIKPIAYQAKCFFQLRKKDTSVELDTAFIILNLNKGIVKRQDFVKLPYIVDYEKFR